MQKCGFSKGSLDSWGVGFSRHVGQVSPWAQPAPGTIIAEDSHPLKGALGICKREGIQERRWKSLHGFCDRVEKNLSLRRGKIGWS